MAPARRVRIAQKARKWNWDVHETLSLLSAYEDEKKNLIDHTNETKRTVWKRITNQLYPNDSPFRRTHVEVQKKWRNLCTALRQEIHRNSKRKLLRGEKLSPILSKVADIIAEEEKLRKGLATDHSPKVMSSKKNISDNEVPSTIAITEKSALATEKLTVEMEKSTAETKKSTVETEKSPVETEKLTVETKKSTAETQKPTAKIKKSTVEAEKPTVEAEKPTIEAEKSTVEAEKSTVIKALSIPKQVGTLTKTVSSKNSSPLMSSKSNPISMSEVILPTVHSSKKSMTFNMESMESFSAKMETLFNSVIKKEPVSPIPQPPSLESQKSAIVPQTTTKVTQVTKSNSQIFTFAASPFSNTSTGPSPLRIISIVNPLSPSGSHGSTTNGPPKLILKSVNSLPNMPKTSPLVVLGPRPSKPTLPPPPMPLSRHKIVLPPPMPLPPPVSLAPQHHLKKPQPMQPMPLLIQARKPEEVKTVDPEILKIEAEKLIVAQEQLKIEREKLKIEREKVEIEKAKISHARELFQNEKVCKRALLEDKKIFLETKKLKSEIRKLILEKELLTFKIKKYQANS